MEGHAQKCVERYCELANNTTRQLYKVSTPCIDDHHFKEGRIESGRTEKLPYSENIRISSWSYDMEGHAQKCVERYCELADNTTRQL